MQFISITDFNDNIKSEILTIVLDGSAETLPIASVPIADYAVGTPVTAVVNGAIIGSYIVQSGDTGANIAAGLAASVQANTLTNGGYTAINTGTLLVVTGPVGSGLSLNNVPVLINISGEAAISANFMDRYASLIIPAYAAGLTVTASVVTPMVGGIKYLILGSYVVQSGDTGVNIAQGLQTSIAANYLQIAGWTAVVMGNGMLSARPPESIQYDMSGAQFQISVSAQLAASAVFIGGADGAFGEAVQWAEDKVRGYITDRFDDVATFAAQGPNRNQWCIGVMKDLTLYRLHQRVVTRAVTEIRIRAFDDAINELKEIQKGRFTPFGLPVRVDDQGNPESDTRFSNNRKPGLGGVGTYGW